MAKKFKTQYNASEFPDKGEVNNEVSMTVPDMTMSIPEILKRYASGMTVGGAKHPLYHGNEDYDDVGDHNLQNMDELERIDYLREKEQELLQLKDSIQKKVDTIRRTKEIEEEIKKELDRARQKDAAVNTDAETPEREAKKQ